ncbi:signal peptidase complex subunit 3 isoform X1 [Peromyscus leucopus]|uniref:signal peptidase complex subunit 3 isoform X1 n=1 Tax=Peromyscus leucopus TaxID=10041 RepID=UPI00188506F6|nr:signal peptidase complex subunit 3 isoform X1 [Peromyscus leucopus]
MAPRWPSDPSPELGPLPRGPGAALSPSFLSLPCLTHPANEGATQQHTHSRASACRLPGGLRARVGSAVSHPPPSGPRGRGSHHPGVGEAKAVRKNVEDFTGPRERSDLGFITFDITADLENIFDWNVKQLFLYLSAEYSTKNNALNQVVLWDKIVLRGDNPKLLLKDMKTKYFFFDDGNGLKGNRNVTLTLSWNVVPNAGILPLVTGSGHVSVPFPDTYEITKSY